MGLTIANKLVTSYNWGPNTVKLLPTWEVRPERTQIISAWLVQAEIILKNRIWRVAHIH